jgi:hypothetical protein
MKIITATMAKNIANDFMNNVWREPLSQTMESILEASLKGQHSLCVSFTLEYGRDSASLTKTFFQGLGYTITQEGANGRLYYTINW